MKKDISDDVKTVYIGSDDDAKTVYIGDSEKTVYVGDSEKTVYVGDADEDDVITEVLGNIEPEKKRTETGTEQFRCYQCFRELGGPSVSVCPYCGNDQRKAPDVNYHLWQGTKLNNRYIIGNTVGFGGFGITYRAWDTYLNVMVAIKEYYNSSVVHRLPGQSKVEPYTEAKRAQFKQELNRFLEEAQYTSKFRDNKNFVYVYNYFEENGTAYMVMEFLSGDTLEDYMGKQGGSIPFEKAVVIFSELADALGKLHEKGIIHRDISPDNIFICEDGTVKLMDLGAARFPNGSENSSKSVIIKPGLAPPEQYVQSAKQGKWTDIYALTATFYWAITGVKPVESTNRTEKSGMELPSRLKPDVPKYADKLITRGMALQPELRFPSAESFKNALQNKGKLLDSKSEIARRRTRRTILIGLFAGLGVLCTVFLLNRYRSIRENALLTGAVVEVWIPAAEGEDRKSVYMEMTEEFREMYPDTGVSFLEIPENEYEEKVLTALSSGKDVPALFDASYIHKDVSAYEYDVSDVFENIEQADLVFGRYMRNSGEVPLGFRYLLRYENESVDRQTEGHVDLAKFLAGKAEVYCGDTKELYVIQDKLPGSYTIEGAEEQAAAFEDLWGINKEADPIVKTAAARLLSYWLGEQAQDILHVQNRNSIPVNRNEFQVYIDVYSELRDTVDTENAKVLEPSEFEQLKELLNGGE